MTVGETDQEKTVHSAVQPTEDVSNYAVRPACFRNTLQECLFVLTATMAIGQTSFYQGSIVGITASIGKDLDMNSAEITWINAGASYVWPSFIASTNIPGLRAVLFYLHSVNWQTCSAARGCLSQP